MARQAPPNERARVEGAVMVLPELHRDWRVVSAAALRGPHLLSGVAARSADDVWVVGQNSQHPVAAHWDGSEWSIPAGPPPSAEHIGAGLLGVAVSAADSVPVRAVAVGGAFDRLAGTDVPLIRHWDGVSWSPWNAWSVPARDFVLTDVAFVAPETAWAVGHSTMSAGTVALRWDGNGWRHAETPRIGKGKLLAVDGSAPNDVWAVGAADRSGLILHFDGRTWTRPKIPKTPQPLSDVAVLSTGEAWAVGRDQVLRWDGRRWHRVDTPVTAANTVTALHSDDVWVAGGRGELAHFDGTNWTVARSPSTLGDTTVWLASDAGSQETWMVGSRQTGDVTTSGPQPIVPVEADL